VPEAVLNRQNVVICGNGAASVALFRALAKAATAPLSITIVGSGALGEGIAYATPNPEHVLNVPAAKMSADTSEPAQFADWLERRGHRAAQWKDSFVPRHLYARYLAALVEDTRREFAQAVQLQQVEATVLGIGRQPDGWSVFYEGGVLSTDAAVLATGIDPPRSLARQYAPELADRFIDDPWADVTIEPTARILIVGTGLTAIDTALAFLDKGHRGQIVMLSRRGLLSQVHTEHTATKADLPQPYPRTASALVHALREAAEKEDDWQTAIDALRPHWPAIWQALPHDAKRRAMRHGLPFFNMHRHRVPPHQGAKLHAAVADGRIEILRGRLSSVAPLCSSVRAVVETACGEKTFAFGRIVNCSGPNSDPERSPGTLLKTLIASGIARPGVLNLGLDIDSENRVRGQDGAQQPCLFAAGALTRGHWWEITAMPEIAAQAANIAVSLIHGISGQESVAAEHAG
jgi:uncharacterized NAD(P)/FAD-binding protein YdhS